MGCKGGIMNSEEYKIIKEGELFEVFQDYAKELSKKYSLRFSITANYNSLLISGSSELEKAINDIRDDIIKYAKDNLDEVYKIILPNPAYTSFSPHINTNSMRTYSLSRVLKENEPK